MNEVVEIDTDLLRASSYNPRIVHDPELMQALTQSIRELGVRQPLIVWETSSGYEVVDGGRRLAAARRLGIKRLPCIVYSGDISSLRRTALSIHLTQDDLTPDELVNMIERLVAEEEFKSVEDVCRYYGLSKKWFYSLRNISRRGRVEGVPASTLAVLEESQLDERRRAELIEELRVRHLPRSAVVELVKRLVENPGHEVAEVMASYLGSLPHRLDDVTLEVEGKYVYRIRRVQGGVEFMIVRGVSAVDVLVIPLDDLEIVKRLWRRV